MLFRGLGFFVEMDYKVKRGFLRFFRGRLDFEGWRERFGIGMSVCKGIEERIYKVYLGNVSGCK